MRRSVWSSSAVVVCAFAVGCGSSSGDSPGGSGDGGGAQGQDGEAQNQDGSAQNQSDAGAGSDAAAGDAGDAATDAPPPAVPPAPQVANLGGTELKTPKVKLIAYSEDKLEPDVDAFITEYGTTTEWASQASEYGIGAFTKLPTVLIPGTPPTTLDDNTGSVTPFQQTLINNTSGTNPAWGAADPSTIYLFVLPQGTDINSGGHCCTDFLGYHYEAAASSGALPYAVVCDCAMQSGDPYTPLQNVTSTVNHELVEAATDPLPNSSPAYAQTDDADAIWTIATGGELADMCEYNTDSGYTPPGAKYMIQRTWSNAAAKAGDDPCVPVASTQPYFNSYAVLSDPITLMSGGAWKTTGVKIAVGQTRTIPVLLSSKGTGSWSVKAWDLDAYLGKTANTTVSLDKTSGSNGDVLQLTIKVNSYDSSFGGAGFVLESTAGGQDNLTMGAVGQ